MNLKEEYLKKLADIGLDITKVHVEDFENFSVVSFSDKEQEDKYNVAVYFLKEDVDYEVIVRKQVNVIDRTKALEKINEYNRVYSKLSFYLEGDDIYALRSYEKYEGDPQEFIDTIAIVMDFISSNNI